MLLLDICYKAVVLKTSCIKSTKKLSEKYRCHGPHPDGPHQTPPAAMGIWRLTVLVRGLGHPLHHPLLPPGWQACSLLRLCQEERLMIGVRNLIIIVWGPFQISQHFHSACVRKN